MFNMTDYMRARRKKLLGQGLCAQCGKYPNRIGFQFCEKCAKKVRDRQSKRIKNPEIKARARATTHLWKKTIHVRALEKIAQDNSLPLKCPCGCDILEILEINHVNGGGHADLRKGGSSFCRDIVFGKRSTKDLNILCKVCNIALYTEKKTGRKWKISFQV